MTSSQPTLPSLPGGRRSREPVDEIEFRSGASCCDQSTLCTLPWKVETYSRFHPSSFNHFLLHPGLQFVMSFKANERIASLLMSQACKIHWGSGCHSVESNLVTTGWTKRILVSPRQFL